MLFEELNRRQTPLSAHAKKWCWLMRSRLFSLFGFMHC